MLHAVKAFLSKHRNSIRTKVIMLLTLSVVPITLLLIYTTNYSIDLLRRETLENSNSTLRTYMRDIDYSLQTVNDYLYDVDGRNLDFEMMDFSDDYPAAMARIRLWLDFDKNISRLHYANGLFVYSQTEEKLLLRRNGLTYLEMTPLLQPLRSFLQEEHQSMNWEPVMIGNEMFLIKALQRGNKILGAFIHVNKLISQLIATSNVDIRRFQIVPDTQMPVYTADTSFWDNLLESNANKLIVLSQHSSTGNFGILQNIYNAEVLSNMPLIQHVVYLISVAVLFIIPFFFIFLRKILLLPLRKIDVAVNRLEKGDMDHKITPYRTSREFEHINLAFNNMTDEIKHFKILAYEEQLEKQRAQYHNLQLQISPHFLLNTFNMVYSLAQTKEYATIQDLMLSLAGYFRYGLQNNDDLVALAKEIDLVRNYLKIQRIRLHDAFEAVINVEEGLSQVMIPPLILQILVENVFKHALRADAVTHIRVDVKSSGELLQIIIEDDGTGMDTSLLTQIRSEAQIADERNVHIGLWNIQKRIRALYPENSAFQIDSDDKGTRVMVTLAKQSDGKDS